MKESPFHRNIFTGSPIEYCIPKKTEVVVVSDYFANDLSGGAELTLEALLEKTPYKVFKLHSTSLTPRLLQKNLDKKWLFGNFTLVPTETIVELINAENINYSIIEFDFKFCVWRSMFLHLREAKTPCNCPDSGHGKMIEAMYSKAKNLFWMSEKQKEIFQNMVMSLGNHKSQYVVSSMFDDKSLDYLEKLRNKYAVKDPRAAILGAGSWIKGLEQTEAFLSATGREYVKLEKKPYQEFLADLAKYKTFVFRPLDSDTCPRVVIEAKLLGLSLETNNNVLHKNEPWFAGSIEDTEKYLRGNADLVWKSI